MILTEGATFGVGVGVGVGVIVTLNSLLAIAPMLSATCTSKTTTVSTSTPGAVKLTFSVSALVKISAGSDTTDQLIVSIFPSVSLAFALSNTLSNS